MNDRFVMSEGDVQVLECSRIFRFTIGTILKPTRFSLARINGVLTSNKSSPLIL